MLYVGAAAHEQKDNCPLVAQDIRGTHSMQNQQTKDTKPESLNGNDIRVEKTVLQNRMTVLVFPLHDIPKVSLQLWYHVGSKDEADGEKGIAHLIEHMIFKGTSGKGSLNISESDINTITHMLSGTCNAFTTQDFTGYLFDMPTQHWKEALPIMADCMQHCSFKNDHLNSEMKAVIQELKMRRDKYAQGLYEELLTALLPDHPYHYPIIGYKQDLWTVRGKDLLKFYKKHYHPSNATLVVVGDVNAQEVFDLAKKYFGIIKSEDSYKRPAFYHNNDLVAKSVTLYRDIAQPLAMATYLLPGVTAKKKAAMDTLLWVLANGKGSRLYKKLVDELQLATSFGAVIWELFDYSMLCFVYEPKNVADINTINDLIQQEIDSVVHDGVQEHELTRAMKQAQMVHFSTLEDTQEQAFDIGKYYLATGDANYVFNYMHTSSAQLEEEIRALLAQYCRPSLMNVGKVVPLLDREKELWSKLQKESDEEDTRFLSARVRNTPVELPSYARTLKIKVPRPFNFPKPGELHLADGLKVLYHNNPRIPKIDIVLRFKATAYYDPSDKPGLYNFMIGLLNEGTEQYTAAELADELESRGISFNAYPGGISMSMLTADLEKGLQLLEEIVSRASFPEVEIEKVRSQILADIKNFWDNPSRFSGLLIRERVYKGHPYSKNTLGTVQSITSSTRSDLLDFYHKVITPQETTMAIVGDLTGYDMKSVLEKTIGKWQGPKVVELEFPPLNKTTAQELNYPINRDQVSLAFAALSVDRKNPDYDKLLLFDQILGGGVLGSMKSRLFKLREQSGLFYSIGGSLLSHADEQPGMVLVKTLVSLDRLQEAEKAIQATLKSAADAISEEELSEAKNAIVNSLALNFESNSRTAGAFLLIDRYRLPANYFDTRAATLSAITVPQVQAAVKRVLDTDQLCVVKVGRVLGKETVKCTK
jgi:zinc protease